jgi:hypothetical protein
MAGIFGDAINNRGDFFRRLAQARHDVRKILGRLPNEPTLLSVEKQLEAIDRWTANGRTPTLDERKSIDMALRMFREFEMTDDVEIFRLRKVVSGVNHYFQFWPDDATAADPTNPDYLSSVDLK